MRRRYNISFFLIDPYSKICMETLPPQSFNCERNLSFPNYDENSLLVFVYLFDYSIRYKKIVTIFNRITCWRDQLANSFVRCFVHRPCIVQNILKEEQPKISSIPRSIKPVPDNIHYCFLFVAILVQIWKQISQSIIASPNARPTFISLFRC